ncbi:hypothetical protein CIK96_04860 [Prevotella sp. P4-98]|uniref:hypothetical protein n=1 Tax=Prevotella sp. P4-98 TaxID=2024219 RepID=UPI000B95DD57|nr:hypothetical protein [Prevotella sp. P4-98]OYP46868.1 hypothetical protein CIK96_04860 [Prevotella sp. P4-98]
MEIEELMNTCLEQEHLPISRYMVDWMNGYLDFFKCDPEMKWEDGGPITDLSILQRLMSCQTDEEIWSLMGKGIGDIQELYTWYKGQNLHPVLEEATGVPCYGEKDEDKAERMLNYFIESLEAKESVKQEAESIRKMSKVIKELKEI